MKKLFLLVPLLSILVLSSCKSPQEEQLTEFVPYPNAELLVDVDELNHLLLDEDTFLIDARSDVSGSFIPDAVHFSARRELGDPDHSVNNFLIGPAAFEEKMRALGLNQDHKVVIMDEGNSLDAARLFYALEYYGFANASILDGGLAAWVEEGYPTSEEPNQAEPGNFAAEVQPARFCDYETIVLASSDPNKIILDVRSEGEYTGEVKRADKNGHIPNAVHLEWSDVLKSEGIPYFKPANEIREIYASAGLTPDKEIIPHCQSNVRGSHTYFTLRLMGYDSVRPYEGSWEEYGNREESVVVQ
ncbi:sulfurtransferase [Rhodohalobacter sp. 614A]|uniref:sulfurtransferase n=1 Tax=Rhodohalobacter sp. 614A TaxID=2908649 RepID=UPI001F35FF70|nr:sulfurtransferase [Rhodohalobacter sp. 614A]